MISVRTGDRTQESRLPLEASLLLANPRARGVSRAALAQILDRLQLEARAVREIGRDGGARALAREAVRSGVHYLLVAGGDGTLNEVTQEIAGTRTALGVLPLGTANDLANRLGLPRDLDAVCAAYSAPSIAAIDLLKIGGRRVATVGGFGLPAHIARGCNELRSGALLGHVFASLGGSIYSLTAAAWILARGAMPTTYSLRTNHGDPQTIVASAILVGLADSFGGGLKLVPDGSLRPGTFFALAVTATSRASLLTTLLRLRAGRSDGLQRQAMTELTSLSIRANGLVGAFADGEWLGLRHRSRVEIEPAALRVLVSPVTAAAPGDRARLREAI